MTTLYGSAGAVTTNPYPAGQCTAGIWDWVHDHFKDASGQPLDMPDLPGNADAWVNDAHQKGWNVGSTPAVNTIAVWGDDMYPDGHVAFVTNVNIQAPADIAQTGTITDWTVTETNFDKTAPYPPPPGTNTENYRDTRTIKTGSKEDTSVKGFIHLDALGITPGGSNPGASITGPSLPDPWSGITAALQQAEADVQQGVKKMEAVLEIAAGMGVMAGGSYGLFQSMKGRSVIPDALKAQARANMRQGVRTAGRQTGQAARRVGTYRPNEGPPVDVPPTPPAQLAANQQLLQGGRRYRSVTARELGARNRPSPPLPARVTRAGRSRILAGARPATAQEAQQTIRWRPAAPGRSRPDEPPF